MSKNSPGVCIKNDGKLSFLSFIRGEGNKKQAANYVTLRDNGVMIYVNDRSTPPKLEYSDSEIWKLADASLLAKILVDTLPVDADMVGMEGFSYGSKGNAGLDVAGYAYCVRKALYDKYDTSKLCIFSPGTVKKQAGKGNAGKDDIMKFFLESDNQILQGSSFWKKLKSEDIKAMKPVDDLIDAYYVQECAYTQYLIKNIQ